MSFLQRCAVRFGRAAQQKPLVSLCVPVYGTEGLVERFLDSVLAQKDAPLFETIVVNDGSPDTVYNYRINTGITSRKEITDLAEWQKVCSTSSVFTIILSYLDEHPIPDSRIREAVQALGRIYRADNLKQLEACVVPSLQAEARALLDEWWGIID
ncbi:glycosyltransferase [Treponema sp. OMZ 805]|uniref:glycosyltransferase n=1 Tax=Treponema sp. OMZ 805 TaxID=2726068 RepID=UPI003D942457